jgi:hypothetical protein
MRKYKINLLKPKEIDVPKRVTYFLYHYLRYVIIVTAIIVICVFFYRYTIDQQVIDLKEKVYSMEAIVKVTKNQVDRVGEISKKIEEIKIRINDQKNFSNNINYVLSVIPQQITLTDFTFRNQRIVISGISKDYVIIKILDNRLSKEVRFNEANIKFKNVTIEKINKTPLGFEFAISILI